VIFNRISRKLYCLSFTRIYFHPIFYHPFPQGVQILLQLFYIFLFAIFLYIIQSSAKSLILESAFLQISFTYTRDSSGPKTLSCGTPEVTLTSLHSCRPTLTLHVWPTWNSLTQVTALESLFEAASFIRYQFKFWLGVILARFSEFC